MLENDLLGLVLELAYTFYALYALHNNPQRNREIFAIFTTPYICIIHIGPHFQ